LAEKLLTEALVKNTNVFDLHYIYDKFIELYYTLSEVDINFMEKCINACKNDIEVFNEIRKNSYNEYRTILKREYKAGLMTKVEYQKKIQEIGPRTAFPLIDAFEILSDLYFRRNKFEAAINVCRQTLKYKIFETDRVKILGLIEKYKKAEIIYSKNEEEKIKLASEALQNDMQKLEVKEKQMVSEIEKEKLKEKVEKLKKVEQKLVEKMEQNHHTKTKELKNIEEDKKKRVIIKIGKNRLQEEYDLIMEKVTSRKFFSEDELEKLKKTLSKLIMYWERENDNGFEIKNMILLNVYLEYYEEKDEKAMKSLEYLINIFQKDDKYQDDVKGLMKLKELIEKKILRRDYIICGPQADEYKELLNEANNESKNKNYDKAVYLAKKASENALGNYLTLTLNEELKLPMYLTKAGRYEEAEGVYETIIKREKNREVINYENLYKIYAKLQTLSNAKKKQMDVFKFSLVSYLLQGLYYKSDKKHMQKMKLHLDVKNISNFIESKVKKIKKDYQVPEIVDFIVKKIEQNQIDLEELEEEINNIVYIL